MKKVFPFEFAYQLVSLIVTVILVHALYVLVVRPRAAYVTAEQIVRMQSDKDAVQERSIYIIIRDFEQETCFVLLIWAIAIMGFKGVAIGREQKLLELDLVPVREGTRILPDDAREYARQITELSEPQRSALLPRALLAALQRFGATRSIQDVSATALEVCETEADRLDSELSMVRYIAWAIPSVGFIGTVRGIGEALGQAHKAVEGDIAGVTDSLGVAFNSTFTALLISIFLMFVLQQLQLTQERFVRDTKSYLDQHLVQHLQVR